MLDVWLAPCHRIRIDGHLCDGGVRRDVVHDRNQQFFDDAAQTAGTALALHRFLGDGVQRVLGKDELGIVKVEQLLVLAHNAVLRLCQNSDKSFLVQRVKHRHNGQTAYQLGDETELDEVVRLDLLQQLLARLILVQRCAQLAAKAEGGVVGALLNELFQPIERAAADEQDILRVDLDELLLRVLAAALGRPVADTVNVPSTIFSSACCTPSPPTSRVMEGFSLLRVILSISST